MTAQRGNGTSDAGASQDLRRRFAITGTLAALMVVLAACGGIDQRAVGDDGLAFFVHGLQMSSGGMDAMVLGTLTTADGCVLLDQDGNRFPVVWPHGTSVEATDPLIIELPSGEQLREGEQVSGGGGYLKAETLDIDVPEACLNESDEVAVFNVRDDPRTVAD
jgi:hypothetical protein